MMHTWISEEEGFNLPLPKGVAPKCLAHEPHDDAKEWYRKGVMRMEIEMATRNPIPPPKGDPPAAPPAPPRKKRYPSHCWMPDWHDGKLPEYINTGSADCVRYGDDPPGEPCPEGGEWVRVKTPTWVDCA